MTTYLWLDCDPGHDDAMAIILAAHGMNRNVIVAGVSTTCGNQTLAKTTDNALRILHLIGRDDVGAPPPPREHHRTIVRAHRVVLSIPNRHSSHLLRPFPAVARVAEVYAGADKPPTRPRRNCPEIHGESGLDGPDIPPAPRGANPKKAIVAMAAAFERILEIPSARPVLVATGALTNVALLFSVYPELRGAVEVVLMGGALGKGNTDPSAEFNIQCDPEAARIVFESGANLTMVPLEATHTALVTPEVRERLLGNPAASGSAEPVSTVGGASPCGSSRTRTRRCSISKIRRYTIHARWRTRWRRRCSRRRICAWTWSVGRTVRGTSGGGLVAAVAGETNQL